ncbi:MAG TPA: S9 family peptidase [Flavobacteriales bacterium]|nr:S9 family peptidase [Flavobacteriales bacterium]
MKNEEVLKDKAPVAKIIPHTLTEHGNTRTDNYFWLNKREDPEVVKYLKAENAYAEGFFKANKGLRDELFKEIKSRVVKDDETVPYTKSGYMYFNRYEGDEEHAKYFRRRIDQKEANTLLLDVNELAKGRAFCEEAALEVSPDNTMLAYTVDFLGRRKYDLCVKDIATGKNLDVNIKNTAGSVEWANDNKTLFYAVEDENTLRSYRIMRHQLGKPSSEDVCVFEENDETFNVDVQRSRSGNYIIISSVSTTTTECLYINANEPKAEFRVFVPRQRDHEYAIDEANGIFYIRTNYKAKNYRVCQTTLDKPGIEHWEDVFVYNDEELTEDFELFKNHLVVESRFKGLVKLKVLNTQTKNIYFIEMPEEDYTAGIGINEEYNTNVLRYYFTSMKTPACEFDYNMDEKTQVLLKQQKINVPYNSSAYTTKRVYVKARDGKEVPISLFYKTDMFKQGTNPCLVYGYGSYGVIMDPYFSGSRLSLVDRGFVFALVHTRGGEDLGRDWYEDGRLLHKKNTFTDFIDATKYLVETKIADGKKLFAQGGSAGGLLMGAVVNMEPGLYKGIIAEVPFVDVISTMMDSTIPLTTGEYDEWGNPNIKEYYDYMLSYSPYDNVKKTAYPAMYVSTGFHDSQVQYWEPAKWVAKLRVFNTSENPILLHTNMDAGHGGASGRYEGLKDVANNYAFILSIL